MSVHDETSFNTVLLSTGVSLQRLMGVERYSAGAGGVSTSSVTLATTAAAATDLDVNGATTTNTTSCQHEEPPRKKLKLTVEDVSSLRKRILDYKLLRVKNLRERFTEQLSELYFLQGGGNLMDYLTWYKRPREPRLEAWLEARRPPPVVPPPPDPPPDVGATFSSAVNSPAQDEMVEKAKQEAHVASRVAELCRAGLWAERRLPRVCEPPRPKTHWDYLLEEMSWLAQDFAYERKWKKQAAKKCARAVQKYFQDKALAAQKAEKAQEVQLKKVASFVAKEIRTFWTNVEKLVAWKRLKRIEHVRKQALDEQLSYIVDRTERYSRQLAANMSGGTVTADTSVADTCSAPPSDEEFRPRGESSDDEETIAAAEREAARDGDDHRRELDALRDEADCDLGDILPPGYLECSNVASDYDAADEDSADEEDTIAEQEQHERSGDQDSELDALRDEAQLDIEELRQRYATASPAPAHTSTATSDENATDIEMDSDDEPDSHSDTEGLSESESSHSEQLEALVTDRNECVGGEEQRVEAAATLAATLQPTGTTLSETTVGTPVPQLLKHKLREYQHVGLHWLATMHARGLNGILADEMGLGKTIQTIALLAHLALELHDWGPHLVVAPTSVVLNWEMEFKKWCPAFKILTYYGTIKERKLKRVGWTKANSFHVCITSYKLVVQDHQSFRRKKWKYLILDEAQNIKNFKSQRWQILLNFQTERRLLLTGTPLQNSLLELWSLMHFLMPEVFASHSEFREWFNPVAALAEGGDSTDATPLVRRLHEVLRPFLLRRLKRDVEKQMPHKYDHVVMCRLSKRQRFLYDDFMSRAKTRESLASGNLLSVINVLMQLRKVCNHPDLFEPRPVTSPLQLPALRYCVPSLVMWCGMLERLERAAALGGGLATLEVEGAEAFPAHRARHLAPPRRLIEELHLNDKVKAHPRPPPAALRLHLRLVGRVPPALPPAHHPPSTGPLVRLSTADAPGTPIITTPSNSLAECSKASRAGARLESRRMWNMRRLALVNERRCWRLPLYGADLRTALTLPSARTVAAVPLLRSPTLDDILQNMYHVIDRFSICCSSVRACSVELLCGEGEEAREWRRSTALVSHALEPRASALLTLLHVPAARQAVAFPHPRLLQYDCGKLQTLDALLRRLKAGGHRCLIFTQMTRMLDVLEAFLCMHGHTYLRLDGSTRVDRRQPLVDRFNSDPRVFAMILSTRSGGVGLNLVGADTVIFYDSDWNPTMDAQAQDRCHRIGQTRDVHVYRLVTASTVEENILRKAEQKRALGHLAIEDGHFTTSYLRGTHIKELFGAEADIGGGPPETTELETERAVEGGEGELEKAFAAVEDEADARAARAARSEATLDLAEFDERIPRAPLTHGDEEVCDMEVDPPDPIAEEFAALMMQLTPIEKYAMRTVECSEAATEAERSALDDVLRQRSGWKRARAALNEEQEEQEENIDRTDDLTYLRDQSAQIWIDGSGQEMMPMWCPPTPPSNEDDVYCESWSRHLYRSGPAAETLLPPVARRSPRSARSPRRVRHAARQLLAPSSLFERGPPRARRIPRVPPTRDSSAPEWTSQEDAALRRALRLQRLPSDPPAALTPNWDWVAELVHEAAASRTYRSPRSCRDRHDALVARASHAHAPPTTPETPDAELVRRKQKRTGATRRRTDDDRPRPPLQRIEAMREATERRRASRKRRLDDSARDNPKQVALLAEYGVEYEMPSTPMEVATRRAERIAKEKQKAGTGGATSSAPGGAVTHASTHSVTQQRIVVATAAGVGSSGAEVMRRVRPQVSSAEPVISAPPQQLLYRQQAQTLGARHQLKILHHTSPVHPQNTGTSVSSEALRTLHLQQLALRRAAPTHGAASSAAGVTAATASTVTPARLLATRHPHVVVAHLAPRPAHLTTALPDRTRPPDL